MKKIEHNDNNNQSKIITAATLQEELDRERARQGLSPMPVVNPRGGSTGIFARLDKSWKNTFDFFLQFFRRRKSNK